MAVVLSTGDKEGGCVLRLYCLRYQPRRTSAIIHRQLRVRGLLLRVHGGHHPVDAR